MNFSQKQVKSLKNKLFDEHNLSLKNFIFWNGSSKSKLLPQTRVHKIIENLNMNNGKNPKKIASKFKDGQDYSIDNYLKIEPAKDNQYKITKYVDSVAY